MGVQRAGQALGLRSRVRKDGMREMPKEAYGSSSSLLLTVS